MHKYDSIIKPPWLIQRTNLKDYVKDIVSVDSIRRFLM